ncbi:MAG: formate dehydrogenase accessory sulfurtransferase FdhD [Promethearchaeati archaeon SRVP18_Atabeyarchaeia-1]
MKNTRPIRITRIKDGNSLSVEDEVIVDTFLGVSLNGKHIASFICSPGDEEEAAIGYLFSSGILGSISQIKETSFKEYNVDVITTEPIPTPALSASVIISACGVPEEWLKLRRGFKLPKIESDLKVGSNVVTSAARKLNELSEVFRRTGGTHAAALFKTDGELVFSIEDISRHVALDKVIGKALLTGANLKALFLVSTGRLASDMVVKAVYAGIPIVSSIAAPFSSGIQLAEATGITLVGFVRGERMNIYTYPERIIP